MNGIRTRVLMYVVAKVTGYDQQLASQAFRQIIKHILSSELEDVLYYLPVACRRLLIISRYLGSLSLIFHSGGWFRCVVEQYTVDAGDFGYDPLDQVVDEFV